MAATTPNNGATPPVSNGFNYGDWSSTDPNPDPTPNPSPGTSPAPATPETTGWNYADWANQAEADAANAEPALEYGTGSKWWMIDSASQYWAPYQGLGSERWNAGPHKISRSFTPLAFASGTGKAFDSTSSSFRTDQGRNNGFIFQDADSWPNARWKNNLWGFQFMYNPAAIQYTNATIDGIDWTNPANSQANLLVGNMTAQFSILINRIVDIALIRDYGGDYAAFAREQAKNYVGQISAEQAKGIHTRGTEWDLEFLWRVLNGDPKKSPVKYNGIPTADWGFISGVPAFLHFNKDMVWKVSLTAVGVNHMLFATGNNGIIPILTEVAISATRIPVIGFSADEDNSVFNTYEGKSAVSPVADATDNTADGTP